MHKILEVIRLASTGSLSTREIAVATGVGATTVRDYLARAKAAGVSWPLPEGVSGESLVKTLFKCDRPKVEHRPPVDFEYVHKELRRDGVTLQLLWEEYIQKCPDGYRYSRYCDLYRGWSRELDVVMRQRHTPGQRVFIDYAGQSMPVIDPTTGEIRRAQIFVATCGASNFIYTEATWTQDANDFQASHIRCLTALGGVPRVLVPDNLKSAVTAAHPYEPRVNRSYAELASYYGAVVLPARPRKPRDKAKVETGVQIVERRILAPLRDRTFNSLEELNDAIKPLLNELNERPFQKLDGSRRQMFEQIERPALLPLPEVPYEPGTWKYCMVNIDYHVEIKGTYYSVPFRYARQRLNVRYTRTIVECFADTERVAVHARSNRRGCYTTVPAHMPEHHRQHAEWTPQRLISWAGTIGPATSDFVRHVIERRDFPEQGFRSALGVMRLAKGIGNDRLESACSYALRVNALSYRSLKSIIDKNLDLATCDQSEQQPDLPHPLHHQNIRGAEYYRQAVADDTHGS